MSIYRDTHIQFVSFLYIKMVLVYILLQYFFVNILQTMIYKSISQDINQLSETYMEEK